MFMQKNRNLMIVDQMRKVCGAFWLAFWLLTNQKSTRQAISHWNFLLLRVVWKRGIVVVVVANRKKKYWFVFISLISEVTRDEESKNDVFEKLTAIYIHG